ncbi:hypothetical protein AB0K52_06630 [Glycomyces sp. NPDC049804]|uniref:hypothetical protein n=1 Tax=Glycomyces sp. NPDC049804 TaxID=3154363 RepID=UPI00343A58CB
MLLGHRLVVVVGALRETPGADVGLAGDEPTADAGFELIGRLSGLAGVDVGEHPGEGLLSLTPIRARLGEVEILASLGVLAYVDSDFEGLAALTNAAALTTGFGCVLSHAHSIFMGKLMGKSLG